MKPTFRVLYIAVTLLCLLSSQVFARAGGQPFSRIIVLGDSLSDTGNFHQASGGIPPAPYFNGRFSNGRVWVEYLAENLGMELVLSDNFAVGGATTGTFNSNNGIAGKTYSALQQQVAALLATYPNGLDPAALYVLWAGANDFFVTLESGGDPAALISSGVGNTAATLQILRAAGAQHILVPNLPNLGVTPFAQDSGMGPAISFLCDLYNQALSGALEALAGAGIETIRLDAFTTLNNMVNFAGDFGFSNVSDAYIFTGGDVDEFLFWDAVHPTTRAHVVLASDATTALLDHYSPAQSSGTPAARVNALNGLVQSASVH